MESWKFIFDWMAVILVFLTFVAGTGALWTGNILNRRQGERLKKFDGDLTAAKSALVDQVGQVATLQKEASDAKTAQEQVGIELAKQQERAASAEKTLLQLRESLKDRTISPDQEKVLVEALKGTPSGPVEVWWTASDTDSYGLALQMVRIFKEAEWPLATERFATGGSGTGFFICVHNHMNAPTYAVSIQKAYKLIGIDMNGFSKSEIPEGSVQIFIGHKTSAP